MSTELNSTAPKPFVFVLMPFSDDFTDVYEVGIKQACRDAGAYCERVDEQIFSERILDRVYNQIAKADIVVADMTGRNANVFYEVGYAHALGKLTILLTQKAEDIPFDLKHFPHIVYGTKIALLRDELEKRVKFFIDNPPNKPTDIKLGLDLFIDEQNVAYGGVGHKYRLGMAPKPTITVYNASGESFEPGEFKIGLITTERFVRCSNKTPVDTTKLPGGGYLHMLPDFPTLFPNAYASFRPILSFQSDHFLSAGEQEAVTVRLFTKQGSRDFALVVECVPRV